MPNDATFKKLVKKKYKSIKLEKTSCNFWPDCCTAFTAPVSNVTIIIIIIIIDACASLTLLSNYFGHGTW